MNHKGISSLSSRTISWLRFACACLVVLLHAFGPPAAPGQAIVWSNGVYDTVRILLSQGVCQIAVPVFFLISGYLFFVRLEEWTGTRYKEKMKRRVRNLVVPFLLWGLIALAVELAVACYKGASPVQWLSDRGWILPLWNNGRFHFNGARNILGWTMYNEALPLDYPLWFVRELIVLNLFAPAIHWWVRKTKAWGLAVLFLLYLFNIWIPLEGFHAGGTFFYSLGAYWRINRQDLTVRCRKWAVPAGIVSLLLLVGMVLTYQVHHPVYTGLCRVFTLTGSVSAIAFAAIGLEKGRLQVHPFLTQSSFFVFAGHTLYVRAIACGLIGLLIPTSTQAGLTLTYLLTAPVCVAIILAVYALLKRLLPKMTSVLTGGR